MSKLYIEGHSIKTGYVISRELSAEPPVRFYSNLRRARRFVNRYNRIRLLRLAKLERTS